MGKDPQNDKAMANDHKDHKENLERPLSTTIRQKVSTKRIKLPLNTFLLSVWNQFCLCLLRRRLENM